MDGLFSYVGGGGQILGHEPDGGPPDVDSRLTEATDFADLLIKLAATSEYTLDCIFVLDSDWRFRHLNARAAREIAHGEDLLGRVIWDAFPGAHEGDFGVPYTRAMTERVPQVFEANYPPLGGWYEVQATPMCGGLLVSFRNINERREAEQRVREAEERYRLAALATNDLIWDWDFDANCVRWSAALGSRFGYDAEQMGNSSKWWEERIHPDDRARVIEQVGGLIRGGADLFECEYRWSRADGGYADIQDRGYVMRHPTGRPWRLVGAMQDLTEQRAAQAEALRSRDLLQTVIDSVSDHIYVKDCSGRFVLVNKVSNDSWNLLGRRTAEIFPEEVAAALDRVDQDVIASGEVRIAEEIAPLAGEDRVYHSAKVPWRQGDVVKGVIGVSRDITDQKAAEIALQRSEALNRSIIEASADGIKLLHLDGTILFMNETAAAALELERPELGVGRTWEDIWPMEAQPAVHAALEKARSGEVARFTAPRSIRASVLKWWDVVVSPVKDKNGETSQLVVISRDVSDRKLVEDKVRWTASHDALTTLPNRALFQSRLSEAIADAGNLGHNVALLQVDIDHFKQINDTLGHDAGDALLKAAAERLRMSVRSNDLVARLGGDEFAVILSGCGAAEASEISEKILQSLKMPLVHDGRVMDCRASLGASVFPAHGNTSDELLKSADMALYAAKSAGRGVGRMFQSSLRDDLQKRTSMLSLGRDALLGRRIFAHYQPKVSLVTGAVTGFEALLRWQHPRLGMRLPGTIAACFEDLELAADISDCIIDHAVADMRRWLDDGVAFGSVAVNAAAAEFRRGQFAERVLETLARSGVPTRCFQLEVTETVFLGRGAEYVEKALKLLSAEGVKIALDDFGTGYASLRHLRQFPVDIIKIDRSFIADMQERQQDAEIVRAVVNLGQSLGMAVVAEGIESRSQEDELRRMGCGYGQGFLYSEALPGSAVPAFLHQPSAATARASRAG